MLEIHRPGSAGACACFSVPPGMTMRSRQKHTPVASHLSHLQTSQAPSDIYAYKDTCIYTHLYISTYIRIYISAHIVTYISTDIYIYIHTYLYLYIHIHVYIRTHIHTHAGSLRTLRTQNGPWGPYRDGTALNAAGLTVVEPVLEVSNYLLGTVQKPVLAGRRAGSNEWTS